MPESAGVWSRRHWLTAAGAAAASLALPTRAQTDEEGLLYERIRASGVLKVAVYKDNDPYSTEAGGTLQGLDIDIARALAAEMQLGTSFLPFQAGESMTDDLRWMVEKGHYLGWGPADLMMRVPVDKYLMFNNRKVLILAPYMRERPVVMHDTRVLGEVRTPDDLKDQPLVAEQGTGLTAMMLGYGSGLLRERVHLVASALDAAAAVIKGQATGTCITRAEAESALARATTPVSHIRLSEVPFGSLADRGWPIGVAIKSANHELRAAVEDAMTRLHASNQLVEIFHRRGLTFTTP